MSDHVTRSGKTAMIEPWRALCQLCNELLAVPGSWWQRITADREAVLRVDEDCIEVRLHGNVLLTVEPRGTGLHCRIAPEYLLLCHPGSRAVLCQEGCALELAGIASLDDLATRYAHVRRRACRHVDRRRMVQDRIFLRHSCILAVDAPFAPGRIDLVGVSPDGVCTFFFVRRYADADLRMQGPGGVGHRMRQWDEWLHTEGKSLAAVRGLMERSRALAGPQNRRYFRVADNISVSMRTRLLIVDFDHAQRFSGLPGLLSILQDGLDRPLRRDDIICAGDPGNISQGILFDGIRCVGARRL